MDVYARLELLECLIKYADNAQKEPNTIISPKHASVYANKKRYGHILQKIVFAHGIQMKSTVNV